MPRKTRQTASQTDTPVNSTEIPVVQHATPEQTAQPPVLSQPDAQPETPDAVVEAAAKEAKDARFVRLAKARMTKAIKAIGNLENLSNKSQYAYTDEQVEKMLSALTSAVAEVKRKFAGTKKDSGGFIF